MTSDTQGMWLLTVIVLVYDSIRSYQHSFPRIGLMEHVKELRRIVGKDRAWFHTTTSPRHWNVREVTLPKCPIWSDLDETWAVFGLKSLTIEYWVTFGVVEALQVAHVLALRMSIVPSSGYHGVRSRMGIGLAKYPKNTGTFEFGHYTFSKYANEWVCIVWYSLYTMIFHLVNLHV